MKTEFTSNAAPLKLKLREELATRLTMAANDLANHLREELKAGTLPIQSDTEALAESIHVQTPRGSDYDKANAAAQSVYVSSASQWAEPVRELLDPTAYSPAHFAERLAPEQELPQSEQQIRVAVVTAIAWGFWWEVGHYNP